MISNKIGEFMESILIEDRKSLTIKGAKKVESSTSTQAVIVLDGKNMVVTGNNLEVVKLDLDEEEVIFSGEIASVKFTTKTEKTPFLKRLFK